MIVCSSLVKPRYRCIVLLFPVCFKVAFTAFYVVLRWFYSFLIYCLTVACSDCREEMYPCTRMYSVHRPIKTCLGRLCLYSLPRVYVINNEICVRTVCQQDEYLKAELCRELSGWPRRIARSSSGKRCRSRRNKPKTWANQA
uniref:Microfibril associated protein 5 n=1 Tax=Poecilia reticulata TaxID=8081 RepID=A0A3P9NUK1_POERE